MERRYTKLVFETWYRETDIERAIEVGEYTKTYFLDDLTVGRVDLYDREEGLCKVSYREVPLPHDELVADHYSKYPHAMCEVWTQPTRLGDRLWVSRTFLYEASGIPDLRFEIHRDDEGQWHREIKLGPNGERIEERQPIFDTQGNLIGFRLYDSQGSFVREYLNDD
jgi:hypothetical protein